MISRIYNGSHQNSDQGYFEWWYFHFIAAENTSINLVLHESDIFGLKKSPYISLSILPKDGIPQYHYCQLKNTKIAKDQDFLSVENGVISETAQGVSFSIVFPTGLMFSGKITKLSHPLIIQDGLLYEDELNDLRSYWVPQIPYACFEGVLQTSDSTQSLKGMAYQDHQWGNIQIQHFVSDWTWGHFSNSSRAIVFFRILTQSGVVVDRLAIVGGQPNVVQPGFDTHHIEMLASQNELENLSASAEFYFPDEAASLSFMIYPTNQLRRRIDERYVGFCASYLRWTAKAYYYENGSSSDMYGVTEYLRIRKST